MAVAAHEIQGTDEWLEYRRTRGGASELPALMRCNPWSPKTPAELFDLKTGRKKQYVNAAMRHGTENEPAARKWIENELEDIFEPQVAEAGRIVASLDGIDMTGKVIVELKAPPKGQQSKAWKQVEANGKPAEHYWWQCQQQLYVTGAEVCYFAVYDASAEAGIKCPVYPDAQSHERLRSMWEWFFEHLDADRRPIAAGPEGDRDDEAWREAAEQYKRAKFLLDEAKQQEAEAKKRLDKIAGEQGAYGCGVKVTRHWVTGAVDYKAAIPDDIDLEQFRKPGRWQTRITVEKEAE